MDHGVIEVAPGGFCAELWDGSRAIYEAILAHPFLSGLTDGSLAEEAFSFYIVQDAHYLRGYARALSLVSAHAVRPAEIAMFATHAAQAIEVEQSLHEELLTTLGIDPALTGQGESAPVTAAYVDHLIAACATGSYADGIAAVLPCYWIYAEVGQRLAELGSPDPRYARWIATYGGESFAAVVRSVIEVAESVGSRLGPVERVQAATLYTQSARYEWLFWDAANRQLDWPSF